MKKTIADSLFCYYAKRPFYKNIYCVKSSYAVCFGGLRGGLEPRTLRLRGAFGTSFLMSFYSSKSSLTSYFLYQNRVIQVYLLTYKFV